ncbi:DUF2461 domain-containing protein [Mucilaginibacter ginkgonis]|uniref:DUF2461 domain-containing protein n=1 Tax=Mucilaginibacter ginkgonis TaxID=2682091 RepID=A0A6I4I0S6_9SPHI|nr:DUF2461 domain-containing protein [Mucilaginibacter ginkgonis]QQL48714.1 DUF2461 domain-containing protein [Mucilaginibacter ginkgonis]
MISQATFNFIKDVTANNDREWFAENKIRYDQARENMIDFTAAMLAELAKTDAGVKEVDPKKAVQRIYRDIRFSKNKTPYKNHFGVSFASKASKPDTTGYYLHIMPLGSFVGGGIWQPQSENIKAIRQEIDYNGAAFKEIVDSKKWIDTFGEFRNGNSLKTTPKGYDTDHEDIALLKLKDFIGMHNISTTALTKKESYKTVANVLEQIYPLNEFLNNAIA